MYGSLGLTVMPIMQAAPGILANSRKGYWRIAGSPILQAALPTAKVRKEQFSIFLFLLQPGSVKFIGESYTYFALFCYEIQLITVG